VNARSRIFISAAHKSSGKTTISIGLCRALTDRGHTVAPFKKGPDYIDPMWLASAASRDCYNLDFYTMQHAEILNKYHLAQTDSSLSLIEGNKGLYDGLDLDGKNSNAALAKLLQAPVILVIDARGMTRGIAPLILGYKAFDADVNIAAVILNQLGGSRHESKLRAVIEHYTDVPVIGAVHRNAEIEIKERHLGLMPSNESQLANTQIKRLAKQISQQVDLDSVIKIASDVPSLEPDNTIMSTIPSATKDISLKLGVAIDSAFGFYYPDDLNAFEQLGVEIIKIDLLNDKILPEIDGLFIGGGFPETHMPALEDNLAMRQAIKAAIENGLACYAECGGLMYLAESITWDEHTHKMSGVIPAQISMHKKPQGRGYIQVEHTGNELWSISENQISAHEFHYSTLENLPDTFRFAYKVNRGTGIDGQNDGIIYKNMLASYAHLKNTIQSPWVKKFVEFMQYCKNNEVHSNDHNY